MFKIAALCFTFVQLACGDVQIINADVDAPHFINDCLNKGANPVVLHDNPHKPHFFYRTQEETRRYPESGFFPKPITCITVTTEDSDEVAGYPKITAGGVGNNYVTIHFKTQYSQGYDFLVSVSYDNSSATLV